VTRINNDHIFQRFGDLDFPIEGSDVSSTDPFAAFDPGRTAMLALFKAAINQELAHSTIAVQATSPWYVARANTRLATTMPIETTLYEPPRASMMRGARYVMPLLCLYRTRSEHNEHSLGREQVVTRWGLDYVLGPLTSADYGRIGGVLTAVRAIIRLVIRRGFHPAYESGAQQFGSTNGHFASIRAVEDQEGPAVFGREGPSTSGIDEQLEVFAMHLELETTEHEAALDPVAEATVYDGADFNIGVGSITGILPDMIQANTTIPQQAPFGEPEGR
jgi:hypothetical protein